MEQQIKPIHIKVESAESAMRQIIDCLQMSGNITQAAKDMGLYPHQLHNMVKLIDPKVPSFGILCRVLENRNIKLIIGKGKAEPVEFTPENCKRVFQEAFKDYRELSRESGIAYVTAYELTIKRKDNTNLRTIVKFAESCNARFII